MIGFFCFPIETLNAHGIRVLRLLPLVLLLIQSPAHGYEVYTNHNQGMAMASAFPPGYGCESRLPTASSNSLCTIALSSPRAAVTPCEYTRARAPF